MQDICGKVIINTFTSIFLKPMLEARGNVIQKQYATFSNPKMYPYTNVLDS